MLCNVLLVESWGGKENKNIIWFNKREIKLLFIVPKATKQMDCLIVKTLSPGKWRELLKDYNLISIIYK